MAQALVPSASAAAAWLLNDAGFGGLSPFVTQDWMPDTADHPDEVVAVWEYPGITHPGMVLAGAPQVLHARLQVRARAGDYDTARRLCTRAWRVLSGIDGRTVTAAQLLELIPTVHPDDRCDVTFLTCYPTDQPTLAERGQDDRVVFTCNFDAYVEVPQG